MVSFSGFDYSITERSKTRFHLLCLKFPIPLTSIYVPIPPKKVINSLSLYAPPQQPLVFHYPLLKPRATFLPVPCSELFLFFPSGASRHHLPGSSFSLAAWHPVNWDHFGRQTLLLSASPERSSAFPRLPLLYLSARRTRRSFAFSPPIGA